MPELRLVLSSHIYARYETNAQFRFNLQILIRDHRLSPPHFQINSGISQTTEELQPQRHAMMKFLPFKEKFKKSDQTPPDAQLFKRLHSNKTKAYKNNDVNM
jgi:hypothetical protein